MNLNKQNTVEKFFHVLAALLVVALFAGVVFATGATADAFAQESAALKNNLNGAYQKSLDELVVLTGEMQSALSKVQVAGTPYQYTILLSEVWRTSASAATALCSLPASFSETGEMNAFFVRAGDYAYTLLKKAAQGTPLTVQDMEQLATLYNAASQLLIKLQQLQSTQLDYTENMDEYDFYSEPAAVSASGNPEDAANREDDETGNMEYPHLIYDGPFSESTEQAEALGLTGEDCTAEQAAQKAKEFLGDMVATELTYTGVCQGSIATYNFTGSTAEGQTVDIEITVKGGHCLTFRVSGMEGGEGEKPDESTGSDLAEKGRQFLESKGFSNMVPTYAQYYGTVAVVNYAWESEGVIVYSDLIKVWVDVNTGAIMGMEASGYFNCHRQRSIPAPVLLEGEAMEKLSPVLEIKSVSLALIPITVNDERLCFEFKCTYGGDSFIVYVNALTGVEEQVFRIIDSDQGQLVV